MVDGGFSRLSELSSGTNLPGGEIHDGHELPNHRCPEPNGYPFSRNCNVTVKFNTIADAEECCEMCRSMSWLPHVGGVVETDENNTFTNPCVAWQIVHGRCRILRQEYFDYWNPGMTVHASLTRDSYQPPGNTGWVVPKRGCGSSEEFCNYFSFIYYRQFREGEGVPVDISVFQANGTNLSKDALYRKVVSLSIPANVENMSFELNVSSVPSRHDRRPQLIQGNQNRSFTNITTASFDDVVDGFNSNLTPVTQETAGTGDNCGRIEVHASTAMRKSGGYEIFDEDSSLEPICLSECVPSGGTAYFLCSLQNSTNSTQGSGTSGTDRRLAEALDNVVISFTSIGTGYDTVDFGVVAALNQAPTTTATTTTRTSSTATTVTHTSSTLTQTATTVTRTTRTYTDVTMTSSTITSTEEIHNLTFTNDTSATARGDGSVSSGQSAILSLSLHLPLLILIIPSLYILHS